ncbi:MAG: ATP-binding protein [Planctomycetota bacterium]
MTDLDKIKELIAKGESEALEFKKSTGSAKEAFKTLCAFLNGKGGTVLFGVLNDGEIVGQEISDSTHKKIASLCRSLDPSVDVDQLEVDCKGNSKVLKLTVTPPRETSMFLFDGRAYRRISTTTSEMSAAEIERRVSTRPNFVRAWEGRAAIGFNLDHLNIDHIQRMVSHGDEAQRVPTLRANDPKRTLESLDLLTDDREITNAAVVLFGRQGIECKRLPQCTMKLARFRGIDKSSFEDLTTREGGAFFLLNEAESFIRRYLPVSAKLVEGDFRRQETPLIPWDALREALINALIHKNYADPDGSIDVAIYDDRLEIRNLGGLPEGVKVEELSGQHDSVRRNRLIAQIFFRAGLIEMWGSGTAKIARLCQAAANVEVGFQNRETHFGIVFRAPFVSREVRGSVDAAEKALPPTDEGLSAQEYSVLVLFRGAHSGLSRSEIVDGLEKSGSTVARTSLTRILDKLLSNGYLEKSGQSVATRYVMKNDQN